MEMISRCSQHSLEFFRVPELQSEGRFTCREITVTGDNDILPHPYRFINETFEHLLEGMCETMIKKRSEPIHELLYHSYSLTDITTVCNSFPRSMAGISRTGWYRTDPLYHEVEWRKGSFQERYRIREIEQRIFIMFEALFNPQYPAGILLLPIESHPLKITDNIKPCYTSRIISPWGNFAI